MRLIALREGSNEVMTRAHEGTLTSLTFGQRRTLEPGTALASSIIERRTVHLTDFDALPPATKALWTDHNVKAALAAPMLREGMAIGSILLRKPESGPFTPRQIELLEAFAAQSVLAIQNARLFHEIEEKSRQLESRASTSRSSSPT